MATTGERLVLISTLVSDTAMNHFLNIETGGGGETIYVDRAVRGVVRAAEVEGIISVASIIGVVEILDD